jgi:hypothetical protein
MSFDLAALRSRAHRFRQRAAELQAAARDFSDPKMIDIYSALVAEFDLLAYETDRLADEIDRGVIGARQH